MGEKFKTWEELEKELDFPGDQNEEIRLEGELIEAFVETQKRLNLSHKELSDLLGIKPSKLNKIQDLGIQAKIDTMMSILYPMGYTLKVVHLESKDK